MRQRGRVPRGTFWRIDCDVPKFYLMFLKYLYIAATWTYVAYLTVQVSLHWNSNHTVTDVKIVKFNESNIPCVVFVFYDLVTNGYLQECPNNLKILDNGNRMCKKFGKILPRTVLNCFQMIF